MPALESVRVRSVEELGRVVRTARQAAGTDQVTTAGISGVGTRFLGDLERGRPNLRVALVLRVLERLGLEVWIVPRGQMPRSK